MKQIPYQHFMHHSLNSYCPIPPSLPSDQSNELNKNLILRILPAKRRSRKGETKEGADVSSNWLTDVWSGREEKFEIVGHYVSLNSMCLVGKKKS